MVDEAGEEEDEGYGDGAGVGDEGCDGDAEGELEELVPVFSILLFLPFDFS